MTQERPEVDTEDAEAIAAYDRALRDFTIELNRLHIAFGAPSYAVIAKASVRPKLTKAGINEALSGKRLPSIDSLLEFVRVVSSPLPPPVDAPAPRCQPELAKVWRTQWQEVKFAQRQAHAPWRRLRDTVRKTLDEAYRQAEAVRAAAYEEAERIVSDARHTAGHSMWPRPDETVKHTDAAAEVPNLPPSFDEAYRQAEAVRAAAYEEAERIVSDARHTAGHSMWPRPDETVKHTDAAAEVPNLPPSFWSAMLSAVLHATPFWFAVNAATTLVSEDNGAAPIAVSEDNGAAPIASLVPGTWYLAVEVKADANGPCIVAQTPDGRRGLVPLSDLVAGVQIG
ncbi:hypothetical protein [Streptomyces sp. NBC_01373]|uniref:hypothetical protein n=1 Tax=Streptomyces sp. NBC_01373 TaxID=2903843 RepID=UPI00225BEDCD|nr:hypothetical protein [Streptomyces sp. NBC_01373]MCX4707153.1 hypothetical protein [Streptomyces sp. NBC_01373]